LGRASEQKQGERLRQARRPTQGTEAGAKGVRLVCRGGSHSNPDFRALEVCGKRGFLAGAGRATSPRGTVICET
jgi:hypothetical protein